MNELYQKYELLFYTKVQELTLKRKNLGISQSQMSFYLSKSLGTIQNFENYKCLDAYLIFGYKKIFNTFK